MDLKVLCKRESVKQMQGIISMNINELVHCWLLATDKKECRASELSRVPDGFPGGLGDGHSPWVTSQIPVAAHTSGEKAPWGPAAKGAGSGCGGPGEGAEEPASPAGAVAEEAGFLVSSWDSGGAQGGGLGPLLQTPPQAEGLPLPSRRLPIHPLENCRVEG